MDSDEALKSLWLDVDLPPVALSRVRFTGAEPALPSSFAIGTAAQTSIGATALAAAELWALRCGRRQQVGVAMRHAAAEFRSERYLRLNGGPMEEGWDKIAGAYRCADGGWVRLHTNFPHHRDRILDLLGCAYDRSAVQQALAGWKAETFETAAAEAGAVAAALRSFDEWDNHPQGVAVAGLPPVVIDKISDAAPTALKPGARPLSGVRVLELTRVIAGPVCGRTLAAHGADVLLVSAPHLPAMETLVIDTGRGKLSSHIDLRDVAGQASLTTLLRGADIFVQGYRPGSLVQRGFGAEDAAKVRPGIVYVSLSAYGHVGPWADRRGFDSLVQTASGFNVAEAQAAGSGDVPKPLPAQVLDHASGYLMAFGAMAALYRRALEGGSWHVRVSLAGTGRWLRSLGRVTQGFACVDPNFEDISDLLYDSPSGFGSLTAVRHAGELSETPARWERPSVPLGSQVAAWP